MISNPLATSGWLRFNELKWGMKPLRVQYASRASDLPRIESVLYVDGRGRIRWPQRNPYLATSFGATETDAPHRLERQWLEVAGALAAEMRERGLRNAVPLGPQVVDARPWQWVGFKVGVRYTYLLDFPHDLRGGSTALRTGLRKAAAMGYECRRTTDMSEVMSCLVETETRQGFDHQLTVKDLELAHELLGTDHFCAYVCYAPDGAPASTEVSLFSPGAQAISWLAGTGTEHLTAGAAQLAMDHAFRDLAAHGVTGYDFAGADYPNLARAKVQWGGRLAPYFVVEGFDSRRLAKFGRDWIRFAAANRRRR